MEFIDSPQLSDNELVERILEIAGDYDADISQALGELRENVRKAYAVSERMGEINRSLNDTAVPHLNELLNGLYR